MAWESHMPLKSVDFLCPTLIAYDRGEHKKRGIPKDKVH